MAWFSVTPFGKGLQGLMDANDIGEDGPSYELCKNIYVFHPLGRKLVEGPIELAQSQDREVTVAGGVDDRLRDQFVLTWAKMGFDQVIFDVVRQSRIYGIATLAIVMEDENEDTAVPLDLEKLADKKFSFSIFDPLNTAGSLTFSQRLNSYHFMKSTGTVRVGNRVYHHSRTVVQTNELPLYIEWTASAYGFSGRSVYQRILYPLKSFLQTMRTDDMVSRKAGVLIAKIKAAGSIVSSMMASVGMVKRNLLKDAETDNVLQIDPEEEIESLNLQNVNNAMEISRRNILNNIAAGAGSPSILVNEETFAEGFGEGTEDAKHVAMFIERFRKTISRPYEFCDKICMALAWNEDFFKQMQHEFPEKYEGKTYTDFFTEAEKNFSAVWPSLITEPDSKLIEKDKVRLEAMISLAQILMPHSPPEVLEEIISWLQENFNSLNNLFRVPLNIDAKAFAEYEPQPMMGGEGGEEDDAPKPPKPQGLARSDSARVIKLRQMLSQKGLESGVQS